jgi:Carboxypeptidase regulatory-like domain
MRARTGGCHRNSRPKRRRLARAALSGRHAVATKVRVVLLSVAPLVATVFAVVVSVSADEASYDRVSLPLTGVTDIAADEARGLVYVSGGPDDDAIAVAAADGSSVREIEGVQGATQLALSPDGTTLFAAITGGDAIAEVDTASFDVRLHPTGDQSCPQEVAVVGDSVWYAEDAGCTRQHTELRVLDPSTGSTREAFPGYPQGMYYMPAIRNVPGTGLILVNDQYVTGGSLDLIDPTAPTVIAHTQLNGSPANILIKSDGSEAIVGNQGWPDNTMSVYRLSDLSRTEDLVVPEPFFGSPVAGDDHLLVVRSFDSPTVGIVDRSTLELLNTIRFGGENPAGVVDMALIGGTLVAMAIRDGSVEMYHHSAPQAPAPTLTASVSDPVVVGHPATVSGTLADASGPISGAPIAVQDGSGTTRWNLVTDSDGEWSFTHTWPTAGFVQLTVVADGGATRKTAITDLGVAVTKLTPTLEVIAPSEVAPGASIEAQGVLSVDGDAVGDAVIEWFAGCTDGRTIQHASGTVTTAADGSFSTTYDPGYCTQVHLSYTWDGTANTLRAFADTDVAVSWRQARLDITTPAKVYVEDDVAASVALTVDGEAVGEGIPIQAHVRGPDGTVTDVSGTTDTEGNLAVHFPAPKLGNYTITAERDATADTLSAQTETVIKATTVPSALSLAVSPSTIEAGQSVDVTGTLQREDGKNAGVTVQLIAIDENGTRRDRFATTGPGGEFTFVDKPEAAGTSQYWVLYRVGDERYEPADDATASVRVLKTSPNLTLRTDRTTYTAGQPATISVDIGNSDSRAVTVTAARSDGSRTVIYEGTVPQGGLTLSRRMMHTETIRVTTPADPNHKAAAREVKRGVRLKLTTKALSPATHSGDQAIYPVTADPLFAAHTTPIRPGVCLRFQLQKRDSGSWRTIRTSTCRSVDTTGSARWRFDGTHRVDTGYRIRANFSGDTLNLAANAPWARFRFR